MHLAGGELWALMLDAASTFDRLVREQASNPQQAETLLANPVYRAISGSLSGAQEYMAIERLHELHVSGEWDLVIVDTPPSRHAIDLLEAPDRLIGFLSHPVYRALTHRPADVRQGDERRGVDVPVGGPPAGRAADRGGHDGVLPLAGQHRTGAAASRRRGVDAAAIERRHVRRGVESRVPRRSVNRSTSSTPCAPAGSRSGGRGQPDPSTARRTRRRVAGRTRGRACSPIRSPGTDDLRRLALAERHELAALVELAGDAPVVELALRDVDVHDVEGLTGLAADLVGR